MKKTLLVSALLIAFLAPSLQFFSKEFNKLSGLEAELEQLKSDVTSERRKIATLEGELLVLRKQLKEVTPAESPVVETTYKANKTSIEDPFFGPKQSEVIAMIFFDYQCSPCRKFAKSVLPALREKYADNEHVKIVLRDFPLESNLQARKAAIFAHCAGEQGFYWEAFNYLLDNPAKVDEGLWTSLVNDFDIKSKEKFEFCTASSKYDREIDADIEDGLRIGAKGAPGLFIGKETSNNSYNGYFIRGAQPVGFLSSRIEELLSN